MLAATYGFAPIYFTGTEGGQLKSLFSVMEVNSWLTGRRGVSLPFTDHCEPLQVTETSLQPVFKNALQYAQERQWKYLEWRGGQSMAESFDCAPQPSLTFFVHQLNLQATPDVLFNQFESSVRRAIRKGEKSGVTVETSHDLKAVREFYGLHCQTRKEHGAPPQPFAFFLNIHRHVLSQGLGMIISAKHERRTIASAIFFRFGQEVIYKFGASDAAFQPLRANNLVMWEAIKRFALEGAQLLNFGRTSLGNEGLRRFKLGWGAEESEARYYRYDLRSRAFVVEKDNTVGWHTRVFQNLPGFLSRVAGAALYKHVA